MELSASGSAMFCGRVLQWLGAHVVRLEGYGDRPWCEVDNDGFGVDLHDYCNSGKSTAPAESLHDLLLTADIMITDLGPALLARRGLEPEQVTGRYPELVFVSVTAFGLTGTRADRPATELTVYHSGGEGYLLPGNPVFAAFPDRAPLKAGRFLADYDAGSAAALGALAGYLRRLRSGRGDIVEISAQEVEIGLNRTTLSRCFAEGYDADRSDRGYDYGGLLRASDGWISLRPTEDYQWQSFARAIGRVDLADDPRFAIRAARDENGAALTAELSAWAADRKRSEIREVLLASGCPGGPFLEMGEVLDDPYLLDRDFYSEVDSSGMAPARLWELAGSAPAAASVSCDGSDPSTSSFGPLAGVRVLDLSWVAAGPYATELLAFLGADVIKVESHRRPDLFRRLLTQGEDLDSSIRFVDINQHKRSLCLNLSTAEGRDAFLRLAGSCDVVVDNFRPGVRERLGIGDAELRKANSRITTVSLSGFGATGPMRTRPGYASVFNAESGLGAMTGYEDGPPTEIRDSNDLRAGTATACAAVAALVERERHGRSTSLTVAAREVLTALQGDAILEASRGGNPRRTGNALGRLVPYGCWRALCGNWVAVAVTSDEGWAELAAAINEPRLLDPGLAGAAARWSQRHDIDCAVEAWMSGRSAGEAVKELEAVGIAVSSSVRASELLADAHLRERGIFSDVHHPRLGQLTVIGSPVRFWSDVGLRPATRSPLIGEHTEEVLLHVARLDATEVASLRERGILA